MEKHAQPAGHLHGREPTGLHVKFILFFIKEEARENNLFPQTSHIFSKFSLTLSEISFEYFPF